MHSEVIRAGSIDAAAEQILDKLKADTSTEGRSKGSAIYFHGWEGLGASAVLQAVAQRLAVASSEEPTGLRQFDKILHIDCSKWVSRRALQRTIAEQLELPDEVMEMFNRQDEDDDYNGLDQGSRLGIPQVQREMHRRIQDLNCRFLVIFHNGSSEEIHLQSFGFPLSEYLDNKVLWTFQGRFRLYPRFKVHEALLRHNSTSVFLSASNPEDRDPQELWPVLVHQEAAEVAQQSLMVSTTCGMGIDDQLAQSLILHTLKLCCIGHHFMMDYHLATHACNYWICDGTVHQLRQGGADELWQAADALKREMLLDADYYKYSHQYFPSHLVRYANSGPHQWKWPSMEFLPIPAWAIPNVDLFQDFDKVSVLKLSRRTFNFSSPPFVHCHNLKFLLLDNCRDDPEGMADKVVSSDEALQQVFRGLLVLHILDTCCDRILSAEMMDHLTELRELNVMGAQDWDMCQLSPGRLPNVRKLRVMKSTIKSLSENGDLFLGMMKKMELFEFSGNRIITKKRLTIAANSNSLLETIIIDEGCVGLEQVSFRGCTNLKNVLLRGWFEELKRIDISGAAVKTLDVSAMGAPSLDEFFALGCDNICAVLWPPKGKMKEKMRKLCIGTTNAATRSSLSVKYGSRATAKYNWYVSVKDARLLRSLVVFEDHFNKKNVHMEVSSAPDVGGEEESMIIKSGCQLEMDNASVYEGVAVTLKLQQGPTQIWPCPDAPALPDDYCYMYIQDRPHQLRRTKLLTHLSIPSSVDRMRTKLLPGERAAASTGITVPDMICDTARILHVHDSKFITCVSGPLQGSTWFWLKWCRVERCPSLDYVFFLCSQGPTIFYCLETLWASQLPRARCIWNLSRPSSVHSDHSFEDLKFMHVDLCPRLTHVLPLPTAWFRLRSLETIEIVWCGHLKVIFPTPLDNDDEEQAIATGVVIKFRNLKRIHLHELPMLHAICGRGRTMYAPKLESIKIRGCWSLTCLPAVDNKQVECDCEKEWWHNLKWDGKEKDKYKPMHPRHYKKTFLRTSVLR